MILIELEGNGPPKFRLEFHPRVTVVSGLSPGQRRLLATSLTGAIGGADIKLSMSVDVDGVPQMLTPELVAALGFSQQSLDNVIAASDLPGAIVAGVQVPSLPGPPEGIERRAASRHDQLDIARRELHEAQTRLLALEKRAGLAKAAMKPPSAEETAQAQAERAKARELVDLLRDQLADASSAPMEDPTERLGRLNHLRTHIEARIRELHSSLEGLEADADEDDEDDFGGSHFSSASAVETAGNVKPAATEPAPEVVLPALDTGLLRDLADRLEELLGQLEKLGQAGPPAWLVEQTRNDLIESEARVKMLRSQSEDGIDVEPALSRANRAFEDARSSWDELERIRHADSGEIETELAQLRVAASNLLERELSFSVVVSALREAADASEASRDAEPLATDDEEEDTSEWAQPAAPEAPVVRDPQQRAAERAEREALIASWRKDLAGATLDLQEVEREIEEAGHAIAHAGQSEAVSVLERQLAEAEAALNAAEDKLNGRDKSKEAAASDLAVLEQAYRQAWEHERSITKKVEFLQREAELAGLDTSTDLSLLLPTEAEEAEAEVVAEPGVPWWEGRAPKPVQRSVPVGANVEVDLTSVIDDDVEFYILSRAAGLRRVGRGESVPLIIDAAFDQLSPHLAAKMFDLLPRIAPIVQIIYLGSSQLGDRWARSQNEMVAAVCRLERA